MLLSFTHLSRSTFVFAFGFCLLLAGCPAGDEYETVTREDADHAEAHEGHDHHTHIAPHDGHLVELGKHQYNAEFVLEAEPKQLVVYLLDAHAENAVAIESQPLTFSVDDGSTITLEPQPQEGDAEGTSSRFVGTGSAVEGISDLEETHGSLSVTIKETEFKGELSHDHDGHDHGKGHDDGEDHDHDQESADKPADTP